MLNFKRLNYLVILLGFFYLAGCGSNQTTSEKTDIYASLKSDDIGYSQELSEDEKNQQFLKELTIEVRTLYLRKNYEDAEIQAERLLRLNSNVAEPYYWLTRIKLALGEHQQAYNLASQGLNYSGSIGMKRELEHLQRQAQMGAD